METAFQSNVDTDRRAPVAEPKSNLLAVVEADVSPLAEHVAGVACLEVPE